MPPPSPSPARIRNIAELARLAGVSTGTVSRALANKSLVNRETRERIQALAREHGFRPNQMARRLRVQETRMIGIVVPPGREQRQQFSDPSVLEILGYLAEELTEDGYDVMLCKVVTGVDDWLERIADSGMLDGVLLLGECDQPETIDRVSGWYRPMVVWGAHRPGQLHCSVGLEGDEDAASVSQSELRRKARAMVNALFERMLPPSGHGQGVTIAAD